MKKIVLAICFVILGILASSCGPEDMARNRAERAERSTGDIRIAVVDSWNEGNTASDLWNGTEMAVDETNKTGVINGRKLVVIRKDDKGTLDKGWLIAEQISRDVDTIAVIGHYYSFITLPCSRIYGMNGMLMISPSSHDPALLRENNKLFIDIHPKSDYTSGILAGYAVKKGFKKIAIGYVYDEYGIDIAREFEKAAIQNNITIVDSVPFGIDSGAIYGSIITKWKDFDIDAVLFCGPSRRNPLFLESSQETRNGEARIDI